MGKHDSLSGAAAPSQGPGADERRDGVSRRTLVKGAAWALPVVASAAAAPAYAASTCAGSGSQTFTPTSTYEPISTTFTVPQGITTLSFVVAGGGGGSTTGDAGTVPGGLGGLVTGSMPVIPGETLTIYAGEGGQSTYSSTSPSATAAGGRGYGSGGDGGVHSQTVSPATWMPGAGGGGGSAIVRGTTPLVVAGGGGGASGQNVATINGTIDLIDTHGGDADRDGPTLVYTVYSSPSVSATAAGGARGQVGTGGNLQRYTGTWTKGPGFDAGSNGGRASTTGGDGGHTGLIASQVGTQNWVVSGGGAGGGGYQGGGGGEGVAAVKQQGFSYGWAALGGNGGGGQSFVASGVTATISLTSTRTTSSTRTNGYVKLSWVC